jgi:uncharacterized protein YgiM (DUF1202 family)
MIGSINRRRWALRVASAAVVIGAIGVGVAVAEDLWVKRPFVDVLGGKGSLYPVVVRAEQGAKLTVIAHEGKWIRVQTNGQEGYVLEDALSSSEVSSDQFAGLKGNQASGASAASAGKGFTPSEFATAKGLSEEPLMNLEAEVKEAVTPEGLDQFMARGSVGDAKPIQH